MLGCVVFKYSPNSSFSFETNKNVIYKYSGIGSAATFFTASISKSAGPQVLRSYKGPQKALKVLKRSSKGPQKVLKVYPKVLA